MVRISSEAELLNSFRSADRDQVLVPAELRFPLALKNFMSWIEPSGHRVYLVFQELSSGQPLGIVFQRTQGSAEAAPAMCQWCHAIRAGSGVSLLTASAGANRRVGIHLCSDLKCGESDGPGVNDMRESLTSKEREYRLLGRMSEFAKKNLF